MAYFVTHIGPELVEHIWENSFYIPKMANMGFLITGQY